MTKAEFSEQFKRLRVAGYRLPVFDGVKVGEVIDEWFATFAKCSVEEFAGAVDRLKQTKTDTFWPATGELWSHIYDIRRARAIKASFEMPTYDDTPQHVREELAGMFREFSHRLSSKMAMPQAEPQVAPDEESA